jgi:hypothetical protein
MTASQNYDSVRLVEKWGRAMEIGRRELLTGLVPVIVVGVAAALPVLAMPRREPIRATRTGIVFDNRYYGFPDDAPGGAPVYDAGQYSTWHYHAFPDDTEGVLRHVATGLTFVTVPVPRNTPPDVELLHVGGVLPPASPSVTTLGYAAQTSAMTGFLDSLKDRRRRLPHSQQAFYFRFLDEEPDEDDADPQWTIRQPAPPLLATAGDRFEDLRIYP